MPWFKELIRKWWGRYYILQGEVISGKNYYVKLYRYKAKSIENIITHRRNVVKYDIHVSQIQNFNIMI